MSLKLSTPNLTEVSPPSDEEFAQWCENPVTMFVATAFKKMAEDEKQRWLDAVWHAPTATPDVNRLLSEAKVRSEAYKIFITAKKEHYVNIHSRATEKTKTR